MEGLFHEDLAALSDLDEQSLLESLSQRFKQDRIYTYIGDILVAINPFKYLPLYVKEVSERYKYHEKSKLPPHIFAVADRAYQSMMGRLATGRRNQCIVISGESGAGKTESTKLLLRQIMELCRANSQLEQQILQVNPLLEAFGNAQTVMNDNSSRFGKYIQLRFHNSSVKGAKINEYLLEKSRVVHQDEGERNFHIFYCMLAGISPDDKDMYGLLDPTQYRYLNGRYGSEDIVRKWGEKYSEVCNAMDMVGFQEQGQFGVQEEELLRSLTCTLSVTRGEAIRRLHNQQQAEDARDSIAKVAYGRVFGWIVSKVNELLAPNVDFDVELTEIGILDIFGFENFAVNRFEQLCINLANEQLQYFFNHHIFLMEQNEYKEEGIEWETISFKDNKPILDLILTKPIGILSLLDEQSAFPQASDRDFVDKLNSKFKSSPHYEVVRSRSPLFTVVHYAGKVQYNGGGFLEMNRDTIPASIRDLFINSVTPLLSVLFAATISRTGTLMPRKAKVMQKADDNFNSTRKQSVGAQFKHSLAVLMEKMFVASPHFVRCIKPNGNKLPDQVDNKRVMDQLRYNGLLETIRIRRDGFSWRPSFKEFAQRYNILLIKPDLPLTKESCLSILNTTEIHGWKCGSSRLFFKYWHQEELSRLLERLGKAALVIQKNYLSLRYRRKYLSLLLEVSRQRQAQREREEENKRPVSPPVPLPRRKKPQPRPRSIMPTAAHLAPVPRPRNKQFEATPFDNLEVHSELAELIGQAGGEERARERSKKRRDNIRWFKETQARKVVRNGAFPCWFHGMITRRQAEDLMTDKPVGCFLIRVGQSREGYTLTYKGANRCRHYMIEMQSNGKYVILGEDKAHPSLPDLVQHHSRVGIKPFNELLTTSCGQTCDHNTDYEDLKGLDHLAVVDRRSTMSGEEEGESSPDQVHLEFQQLFLPPGQNPDLEAQRPPVLRRISDRRHRAEAGGGGEALRGKLRDGERGRAWGDEGERDRKSRPFPRLYPSIRLAMREIQQHFSDVQEQSPAVSHSTPKPSWGRTDS
ncbi:myosin-IIIb-like isoform X2 [Salvelinus namaycush]|uniref:Myosin-IIIb-like isoform X2 n=1 Tax=Salvelinus namaycush TaxID=8040 RepID=A0A8U0PAF9_SALNM|nr:myosin-IIIb-like isoform X2 [Salvelinus namaycush]